MFAQNPTIAGLAHHIREHCYDAPGSTLIPIHAEGTRDPLFSPKSPAPAETGFILSRHLGPDQPIYSLQAQGLDGRQPPHRTVTEMAAHFAAVIQRIQPNQPVNLLGYSAAGLVAQECARQLLLLGRRVNASSSWIAWIWAGTVRSRILYEGSTPDWANIANV